MKKIKKVLLVVTLFACILTLSGCGTKKSIDSDTFKSVMKKNGFDVFESTSQYESEFTLKKSYIASKKDRSYQIEFIEFNTIEEAVKIYDINKKIMEDKKNESANGYINLYGKNYSKYRVITAGRFMALTRINNTLMYVDINQEYEKEANTIIKKMGY